ncbi:MAG: hypothetical protein EA381_17055 [Planctomycetaceae bacterium]|nr:MAG: hypothetical protein EA381_17055 [Planctomycetaceae bacterium]
MRDTHPDDFRSLNLLQGHFMPTDESSIAKLPAHKIPVDDFQVKLLWPVFLQPLRNHDGILVDPELETVERPDFLTVWCDRIISRGENGKGWKELDKPFPRMDGPDALAEYAEFCYLHPFVRNLLYKTRDDIRSGWLQNESLKKISEVIAASNNRNLRILQRDDLASLTVTCKYDNSELSKDEQEGWLQAEMPITSCWLYLFDTQVALLEIHLSGKPDKADTGDPPPAAYSWRPKSDEEKGWETVPLNLSMVLKLQDVVRRLYSAFWDVGSDSVKGDQAAKARVDEGHFDFSHNSHTPARLTLRMKHGSRSVTSHFGNFPFPDDPPESTQAEDGGGGLGGLEPPPKTAADAIRAHQEHVFEHREPFTESVWKTVIAPLEPIRLRNPNPNPNPKSKSKSNEADDSSAFPISFEHILDERMPIMSYIAIGKSKSDDADKAPALIRRINDGDWMRLAFIDDPGDSTLYPYSPDFLGANPLAGVAYDRFWHPTGKPPAQDWFTTRWLTTGYSFSGVGESKSKDFFANPRSGALSHFNNHYFALMMLAQVQRAGLLRFKFKLPENYEVLWSRTQGRGTERDRPIDEQSERRQRNELQNRFRDRTRELKNEFNYFKAHYWCTEVSNQIQGQELFDMIRKHLRLDALYAEVQSGVEDAEKLTRQHDDDRRREWQWSVSMIGLVYVLGSAFCLQMLDVLKQHAIASAVLVVMGFSAILYLIEPEVLSQIGSRLWSRFPAREASSRSTKSVFGWLRNVRMNFGNWVPWLVLLAFLCYLGVMGVRYLGRDTGADPGVPDALPAATGSIDPLPPIMIQDSSITVTLPPDWSGPLRRVVTENGESDSADQATDSTVIPPAATPIEPATNEPIGTSEADETSDEDQSVSR